MFERTLIGLLLAILLSAIAYRLHALTLGGAIAAAFTGAVVLGLGGWTPAVLLVLFFLSSSIFSRLSKRFKPKMEAVFAKSGRRDARQVLANGALPVLFALMTAVYPQFKWLPGIVGALAAVTADTWATEWGVLAKRKPRRITDWRLVPAGTSGGITPVGTLGSAIGALTIGAAAALLEGRSGYLSVALFSGLIGSALDSVLGASLQSQYYCPECELQTEQHPTHTKCGTRTSYVSGISWIDNDVVNLSASAFGALIALIWIN